MATEANGRNEARTAKLYWRAVETALKTLGDLDLADEARGSARLRELKRDVRDWPKDEQDFLLHRHPLDLARELSGISAPVDPSVYRSFDERWDEEIRGAQAAY